MTLLIDTKLNPYDVVLFEDPTSVLSQGFELGVIVGVSGRKLRKGDTYVEVTFYLVRTLPNNTSVRELPINDTRIYRLSSLDAQDISEIRARILDPNPKESEQS